MVLLSHFVLSTLCANLRTILCRYACLHKWYVDVDCSLDYFYAILQNVFNDNVNFQRLAHVLNEYYVISFNLYSSFIYIYIYIYHRLHSYSYFNCFYHLLTNFVFHITSTKAANHNLPGIIPFNYVNTTQWTRQSMLLGSTFVFIAVCVVFVSVLVINNALFSHQCYFSLITINYF